MNRHYCEECKSDFDRIDKGYHPHNGDCGHWECHLYDSINTTLAMLIMIPLIIIMAPILLFLIIADKVLVDDR